MMYLSLTFDYELFFGENNGSYDDVLFKPTYELINTLEENNISATFFADVCSIPVARKYNQNDYVNGFERQICYMNEHGQDIQLHLHPHWFYSKWENGKWLFSSKGYRLHEFQKDNRIDTIISEGIRYLNDTIGEVDLKYSCIAFRAGGFSLQPHGIIVNALYDNGIRIDSSIAPQLFSESEANHYNYRHSLNKVNWKLSEKREWWEDSQTGKCLYEIPIATIDKSPLSFGLRRVFKPKSIKLDLGVRRGSYIAINQPKHSRVSTVYNYIKGYNAISMDAYSAEYLYSQTQRLYKKMNRDCGDQVVAIIGHPKLVNEAYINNLCRYVELIKNDSSFDFISIYDAYLMWEKKDGITKTI